MSKCPICEKRIAATPEGEKYKPFCSERCRSADLARWFGEEYSAPVQTERVLNDALPPPDDGE